MERQLYSGRRAVAGYSLTELLMVVALIGLVMLVSIPAFTQLIPQYRIKSAASQLSSAVKMARQKAIANRAPWKVTLDFTNNRWAVQRMTRRPDSAFLMNDPANWRQATHLGQPVNASVTTPLWVSVNPADLREGLANQFKDVDGDGLKDIVFLPGGRIATDPTKGQTVLLTFIDGGGNPELPETLLSVSNPYVRYNRYAVRALPSGQMRVVAYKQ